MIIDCHNHIGVELLHYLHGDFPYCQHLIDLVEQGHAQGIDNFIIFPMVSNLSLSLPAMRIGQISAGDLETVPYSFENRHMMQEIHELFPEEGASAIAFAMFDPLRNPEGQAAALRELRRDYPIAGLKVQATILQSPITQLREGGRVFLDLAREWDIPVLIHSSVLPSDIWSQASDILDIAEATPGVRFCIAHSLRFDAPGLERLAKLPNAWFDCSAHRIHCDLAVANHPVVAPPERRFDSDYANPDRVLRDLAGAYPDKLMWGSDSPYYSFVANSQGLRMALRSSYKAEAQCLHALPEPLRERAGYRNIIDFLGHPV